MMDELNLTTNLEVEMYLQDLSNLDRAVREMAVKSLVSLESSAVNPLIAYLYDPNNRSRNLAARALGRIRDARAIAVLSWALSDPDEVVRSVAAWALGEIGDASAVSSLLSATRDSKQRVRTRATASLEALGHTVESNETVFVDGNLIRQHISELGSRAPFAQDKAYNALLNIGKPAIPSLINALSDYRSWVRQHAVNALSEIGDLSVRPALEEALKYDKDPIVRQSIGTVLAQMESPITVS
jgi:HEAT repeat protein